MSETMVVSPIIAALVKSEDILRKNRKWNAVNDTQAHFLEKFFPTREELSKFSEKELRSWASWVAAELNKILEGEGFDIRLEEFKPNTFGVVSILKLMVEWIVKGERDQLVVEGTDYPAVKMEPTTLGEVGGELKVVTIFEAYTSSQDFHPVAMLHTKSGDKVYMTIADGPVQDFGLMARINEIRSSLEPAERRYDWLKFPMVDLNQEVDITWLKDMWTTIGDSKDKAYISQALQQTKFKMNEFGARVESAVAVAATLEAVFVEQGLEIDKPFFLWIEREGVSIPVIYAYIDQDDWEDPGNLSDM